MSKRIMIGTVVWCPEGSDSRAAVTIDHLKGIIDNTNKNDRSIFVVNNETSNRFVLDYFEEIKKNYGVFVYDFYPQLNWSRGRNFLIDMFFRSSEYSGLILFDSDNVPIEGGWLERVKDTQSSYPFLHSYMIACSFNDVDLLGQIYIDDALVNVYREFICNAQYMDKKSIKILGGFATKPFHPVFNGFCDCDYGRRLKKAKINAGNGDYIDPIMMSYAFRSGDADWKEGEKNLPYDRGLIVSQYGPIFWDRAAKIEQGLVQVFSEYKNWRDEWMQ